MRLVLLLAAAVILIRDPTGKLLVIGLSMCLAPANVAAYLYTPPLLRGAAVGLLSLLRNEGGSVGTGKVPPGI